MKAFLQKIKDIKLYIDIAAVFMMLLSLTAIIYATVNLYNNTYWSPRSVDGLSVIIDYYLGYRLIFGGTLAILAIKFTVQRIKQTDNLLQANIDSQQQTDKIIAQNVERQEQQVMMDRLI